MQGLSREEVNRAIREGRVNVQVTSSDTTNLDIVKENLFTYFNLIFLILAILLIIAQAWKGLTFLPVVILNILIGTFQGINAKSVLDKVSVLNEPTARVLREGKPWTVPINNLVQNDIVLLSSGNQIPADAVVVHGEVNVNEALLTGEADEIVHGPGENLMSGSFVVSGNCYARLTRVGADSYISRLMIEAKGMEAEEQSEMVKGINMFVKLAGIAIIPIGIILFIQGYVSQKLGFSASVTSMVAALIGMIPEGLYLLVSVTLALGAAKLARKKVMLHDMKSIEILARVDVLCVDKTGTITDNDMSVADVVTFDTVDPAEMNRRKERASSYIRSIPDNNITMQAMEKYFEPGVDLGPVDVMPFSSKLKYSSIRFSDGTYVMGAPDIVLSGNYSTYQAFVEEYARKGLRVLVFGKIGEEPTTLFGMEVPGASAGIPEIPRTGIAGITVEPLLFILLENPIRENAKDTFTYFAEQDVEVKVISGDNPLTVSRVAASAGIAGAEKYVDASTLRTKDQIAEAVQNYTVFGRVKPEQKQMLVQALQDQGRTVAMTGDGVNDILAMKDADCSIAMAAGSDAAVQSSQVVLLDSDFSHMKEIVGEGRQIINNIERSATLFLVKNIFSMLLAVFSIINVMKYPLEPSQISLISGFNIGIPAFFLALEPNANRIQGRFMAKVLLKAAPAALTDFFVIAALVVFGNVFGVSPQDISVAATWLLAIVGFIILFNISKPINRYRAAVMGLCIVGMLACIFFMSSLFSMKAISMKGAMLFLVFAIVTEPLMRYLTMLAEFVEEKVV